MPTSAESLMSIAINSNLRIHERIKKIKGNDKVISSEKEANAIIAIPASDVLFTDNKDALALAKMEAYSYLNGGGKNLWDYMSSAYKYCKKQGSAALTRISNYFNA